MNNPLHNREANSGSFEFLSAVEPLEHAKQLPRKLHIEANPVVSDEVHGLVSIRAALHLDGWLRAGAGELERIGEEVGEDLLQECWICGAIRQVADLNIDLSPRLLLLQVPQDLPDEICCLHAFLLHG